MQESHEYRVVALWWPDGWEPAGPLDVPKCVFELHPEAPVEPMPYDRALAAIRGLNRQNLDRPGTVWYVVAEARREVEGGESGAGPGTLRVIYPEGSGRGDCSHCSAHEFPCASGS
jgi:hypothetical protein